MDNSFFTDSELAGLREISVSEISELIEQIKAACAGPRGGTDGGNGGSRVGLMFHTITGSAGVAGLMEISGLAAEAESLFAAGNGALSDAAAGRIREIIGIIENLLGNTKSVT